MNSLSGQRISKCLKWPCSPFVTPCFCIFSGKNVTTPNTTGMHRDSKAAFMSYGILHETSFITVLTLFMLVWGSSKNSKFFWFNRHFSEGKGWDSLIFSKTI